MRCTTPPTNREQPVTDTHVCEECGTGWTSESSADACCENDDLTGYDPSRHRLSYRLSYD